MTQALELLDDVGMGILVLLKRSEDAQAMLVTWPKVAHLKSPNRRRLEWAKLTGLDDLAVEMNEPMLLMNGFCRPDGSVDDRALQLVQALMAKELGLNPGRSNADEDGRTA